MRELQHPFIAYHSSPSTTCNEVSITMGDTKPSKVWEPFSKMFRMPEEDWAVLESVYNDYRYRQGDLQRMEFIKRIVAKGVTSYLFQLKSRTPEALVRIAQSSNSIQRGR